MTDLWHSIFESEWRNTPCVVGRVATESDVKAGRAVFYVKGASSPAPMRLPHCAIQTRSDGSTIKVVVVQAEYADNQTLLGVRPLAGGNGICLLQEVELLDDWNSSGLPPNTSLERTRER